MKIYTIILLLCLGYAGYAQQTYYVTTQGADQANRDGRSPSTAWRSLAYACERVPAGDNIIKLGAGTFTETQSATPKSGVSIVGNGAYGEDATVVQASKQWEVIGSPRQFNTSNYLIAVATWEMGFTERVNNLTITDISFRSNRENLLDGAIMLKAVDDILIRNVRIEDFSWNGVRLRSSNRIEVADCEIINSNVEEDVYFSGSIHTRFIKDAKFHNIRFVDNLEGERMWGVSYKGSGHENVKIYDCSFMEDGAGFDIEIPHENEFGVEIFDCQFDRTISIPKVKQGADPNEKGFAYSFWIHDNYFTHSYSIEGPRSHLRINNNFFDIKDTKGRVYSQFEGSITGPMWIHHNVITNVDRAFIWKKKGQLDSVYVYNNTVYLADAKDRTAAIIDSWNNMTGWQVKNNIFVSADAQPRRIGAGVGCSSCEKVDVNFANNTFVNVSDDVPAGNFTQNPDLQLSGKQPNPYYRPATGSSFVVDRGVDVGLPFLGGAPDLGAYEWDASDQPKETTTVTIYAAGRTSTETMELRIDGQTVDSWTEVGGNANKRDFVAYTYTANSKIGPSQIQVAFTNDDGADRDLRIDKIEVDGVAYQSEAASTYSTGTWKSGSGCDPGYKQSEWLHCAGHFAYEQINARTADTGKKMVEESVTPEVKLFPNPAQGVVRVQVPPSEGPVVVTLSDGLGREILRHRQTDTDGIDLPLHQLAPGLYQVRVAWNGEEVRRKLLVD